jgi:acyl carrier protein
MEGGFMAMTADEIRDRIKKSIASITYMDPAKIDDSASYKDDLAIDSLSILEIVVDVEYQFQIKVPEEELSSIRTIGDTIDTVQKYLWAEAV